MAACFLPYLVMAQEKITVFRNGNKFLVQSGFSEEKDIVLSISRNGNEAAYFVPRASDILDYRKGELMHSGGDDFPACRIGRYVHLGGNHGSSFGAKLNIPDHCMKDNDIGAKLIDRKGSVYYVMRIIDEDNILIHPDGNGELGFPQF